MSHVLPHAPGTLHEAPGHGHAGFFTFLRKPLELDRLRQAVQMLIHSHFGGPLTPLVTPPADPQQHLQRPQPPSNPPRRQF